MNKVLLYVAVPLLVSILLIVYRGSDNPSSTTTTTIAGSTTPAGVEWSKYSTYLIIGLVVVGIVWYFNQKSNFLNPQYKEEEIIKLLRGWLWEHNGMILRFVKEVDYKPLINPKLIQVVFQVSHPESLSTKFCYVEFYRGRFRALKKDLSWMEVENLLEIRLMEQSEQRFARTGGYFEKIKDKMRREERKPEEFRKT